MNKKKLIKFFADKNGISLTKAASEVESMILIVEEALEAGERVMLPGFGTFEVAERASRMGRNPRTGEKILISAKKSVRFKPGRVLKARVKH